LQAKKSSTLEEMEQLSASIALTDRYLAELDSTESQLRRSLEDTRKGLQELRVRMSERGHRIEKRVRSLFVAGGHAGLVLPRDPSAPRADWLRRMVLMRRVVRQDQQMIDSHRRDEAVRKARLQELQTKSDSLKAFQDKRRQERNHFLANKRTQQNRLKNLSDDESKQRQALATLRKNAQDLENILKELEKRRKAALAQGKKKPKKLEKASRYCMPVEGDVVSRYGLQYHETLKTQTRNLGIEIEGRSRQSVKAAVSGEVALVTTIPGYGPGIILDNGSGYFTIYANLEGVTVKAGDAVKTCQEMARLAPQPGRLYFEVRQGTKTLDPESWLRGK
jgi:septal ring factor EnvC (AmiA/AmiB activator)